MLRKRGKIEKRLASPFAIAMVMLIFVSEIFNILESNLNKITLTVTFFENINAFIQYFGK